MRFTLTIITLLTLFICCDKKKSTLPTVEEIYSLQNRIAEGEIDTSFVHIKRADSILQLIEAPDTLKAENNYLKGLYFRSQSQLDSASIYFYNAMEFIADSVDNDRRGEYFQTAWRTYYNQGQYGDAITVLTNFKSKLDFEKQTLPVSWAYYNEEATYRRMRQYDKALQVNSLRVKFARERDTTNLSPALIARAEMLYLNLNNKKEAFRILDSLIQKSEHLTYHSRRQLFGTYGVLSYYEGDYNAAYRNYKIGLENVKKTTNSNRKINNLINAYNNLAEVCMDLKLYDSARKYLDTVKSYGFENIDQRKRRSLLNYELRLAIETNKSSNSIRSVLDSIIAYQDKQYLDKFSKELLALEKANEKEKELLAEKQESDIRNLKLESRIILITSIALSLFIIAVLFYRQKQLRFRQEGLQMQQRLLRSQMNPHFTFNTLSAIQSNINKDKDGSVEYLLKFSRLLRLVLENSTHNYVLLEKELESIRKYLDLQLFRFPGKFDYQITLENMEEDDPVFIPPMLIQPFVENSIEHGFSGIDHIGKITIHLRKGKKVIYCRIEDNGKGLIEDNSKAKESTSVKLISDYLKKTTKKELQFNHKGTESGEESGLVVSFHIPFNTTEYD